MLACCEGVMLNLEGGLGSGGALVVAMLELLNSV